MQTQIIIFKVNEKSLNLVRKLNKKTKKLFNKNFFNLNGKLERKIK